jgi:hypothetical protein
LNTSESSRRPLDGLDRESHGEATLNCGTNLSAFTRVRIAARSSEWS